MRVFDRGEGGPGVADYSKGQNKRDGSKLGIYYSLQYPPLMLLHFDKIVVESDADLLSGSCLCNMPWFKDMASSSVCFDARYGKLG